MFAPEDLIEWAFAQNKPTIVTTSFGHHSAVLLDMVYRANPYAQIVWIDTQFNTPKTLQFKQKIIEQLKLNVIPFRGKTWTGIVPFVGEPDYDRFVDQVKLEPFRQVLNVLKPAIWITGIRREQTAHRNKLNHIEPTNGLTKVSPLLEWREQNMQRYIDTYSLPNESNYFDPTKVQEGRECGLHTHAFQFATT